MSATDRKLQGVIAFSLAITMGGGCSRANSNVRSASPQSSSDDREYPGELVAVGRSPRDFMVRQKISLTYKKNTQSLEAILQKIADELLVVGLSPLGTKAFVLKQTGNSLQFEKFVPFEMPFDPEYILRDIHRSFFWHLWPIWPNSDENAKQATLNGERSAIWAGERVIERWSNGQLLERRFERMDGRLQGQVRIRYDAKNVGYALPPKIEIDNGWFGYRLVISNIDYRSL